LNNYFNIGKRDTWKVRRGNILIINTTANIAENGLSRTFRLSAGAIVNAKDILI